MFSAHCIHMEIKGKGLDYTFPLKTVDNIIVKAGYVSQTRTEQILFLQVMFQQISNTYLSDGVLGCDNFS